MPCGLGYNKKLLENMFLVLLLVFTIQDCFGHSQFEGYFSAHVDVVNEPDVFTDSLVNEKASNHVRCAKKCVVTPKCNSFFYRKATKECILHEEVLEISGANRVNEWKYWYRKTQYTAKKKSAMLMFANHALLCPYTLDLESYNWTQYTPEDATKTYSGGIMTHLDGGKGSLAYDYVSQTLFWTDNVSPMGYVFSTPLEKFDDLNFPKISRVTQGQAVGVSLDSKRRLLFFLRRKNLNAYSLKTRHEIKYGTVYGQKEFDCYCTTAVHESKRRVYFHLRHDKRIYWTDSPKSTPKHKVITSWVLTLTVDKKGNRLVYLNPQSYKEVWSLSLDNQEETLLIRTSETSFDGVYPMDDYLLFLGPSQRNSTLRTRDGKKKYKLSRRKDNATLNMAAALIHA